MPSNSDKPWGLTVPGRPTTPSEGAAQQYSRVGPPETQKIKTFDNGTCIEFGPDDPVDEFLPGVHPFVNQIALIDTAVRDCRAARHRYEGDNVRQKLLGWNDVASEQTAVDQDPFDQFRTTPLSMHYIGTVTLQSGTYCQVPSRFASCGNLVSVYSLANKSDKPGEAHNGGSNDTRFGQSGKMVFTALPLQHQDFQGRNRSRRGNRLQSSSRGESMNGGSHQRFHSQNVIGYFQGRNSFGEMVSGPMYGGSNGFVGDTGSNEYSAVLPAGTVMPTRGSFRGWTMGLPPSTAHGSQKLQSGLVGDAGGDEYGAVLSAGTAMLARGFSRGWTMGLPPAAAQAPQQSQGLPTAATHAPQQPQGSQARGGKQEIPTGPRQAFAALRPQGIGNAKDIPTYAEWLAYEETHPRPAAMPNPPPRNIIERRRQLQRDRANSEYGRYMDELNEYSKQVEKETGIPQGVPEGDRRTGHDVLQTMFNIPVTTVTAATPRPAPVRTTSAPLRTDLATARPVAAKQEQARLRPEEAQRKRETQQNLATLPGDSQSFSSGQSLGAGSISTGQLFGSGPSLGSDLQDRQKFLDRMPRVNLLERFEAARRDSASVGFGGMPHAATRPPSAAHNRESGRTSAPPPQASVPPRLGSPIAFGQDGMLKQSGAFTAAELAAFERRKQELRIANENARRATAAIIDAGPASRPLRPIGSEIALAKSFGDLAIGPLRGTGGVGTRNNAGSSNPSSSGPPTRPATPLQRPVTPINQTGPLNFSRVTAGHVSREVSPPNSGPKRYPIAGRRRLFER